MQDVEHVEVHWNTGSAGGLRIAELHPALEAGETGTPALERHDLPVHDEVGWLLRRQRIGDLRVVVIDPQLVARHQPYDPSLAEGQAPLAIELAFVDPGGV